MSNEIINRLERIETKLDAVIKAMHDYDGNNEYDSDEEYGESSFEAFMDIAFKHVMKDEDGVGGMDRDNDIQDKRVVGDKSERRTVGNKLE